MALWSPVQLDTSKVESGNETGYYRFINKAKCSSVLMMIREECLWGGGGAWSKKKEKEKKKVVG